MADDSQQRIFREIHELPDSPHLLKQALYQQASGRRAAEHRLQESHVMAIELAEEDQRLYDSKLQEANERVAHVTKQLTQATEKNDGLESKVDTQAALLRKQEEKLRELRQELDKGVGANDQLLTQLGTLRDRLESVQSSEHQLRTALEERQRDSRQAREQFEAELEEARTQSRALQRRLDAAETELAELRAQLDGVEGSVKSDEPADSLLRNREATNLLAMQAAAIEEHIAENRRLSDQVAALQEDASERDREVLDALHSAEDRAKRLQQEKNDLEEQLVAQAAEHRRKLDQARQAQREKLDEAHNASAALGRELRESWAVQSRELKERLAEANASVADFREQNQQLKEQLSAARAEIDKARREADARVAATMHQVEQRVERDKVELRELISHEQHRVAHEAEVEAESERLMTLAEQLGEARLALQRADSDAQRASSERATALEAAKKAEAAAERAEAQRAHAEEEAAAAHKVAEEAAAQVHAMRERAAATKLRMAEETHRAEALALRLEQEEEQREELTASYSSLAEQLLELQRQHAADMSARERQAEERMREAAALEAEVARLSQVESTTEALRKRAERAEQEVNRLREAMAQAKEQHNSVGEQLAISNQQGQHLHDQIAAAQAEVRQLDRDLASSNARLIELETKLETAQHQYRTAVERAERAESQAERMSGELSDAVELREQLHNLQQAAASAAEQAKNAEARASRAESDLQASQFKANNLSTTLETTHSELLEERATAKQLRTKVDDMRDRLSAAESEAMRQQSEAAIALSRAEQKNEALTERITAREGERDAVRGELEEAKRRLADVEASLAHSERLRASDRERAIAKINALKQRLREARKRWRRWVLKHRRRLSDAVSGGDEDTVTEDELGGLDLDEEEASLFLLLGNDDDDDEEDETTGVHEGGTHDSASAEHADDAFETDEVLSTLLADDDLDLVFDLDDSLLGADGEYDSDEEDLAAAEADAARHKHGRKARKRRDRAKKAKRAEQMQKRKARKREILQRLKEQQQKQKQRRRQRLQRLLKQKNQAIAEANDRTADAEQRNGEVAAQLSRAEEAVKELEAKLQQAEGRVRQREASVEEVQAELNEAVARLHAAQDTEIPALRSQLEAARQEHDAAVRQIEQLERELRQAEQDAANANKQAQRELQIRDEALQTARADAAEKHKENTELSQKLVAAQTELGVLQATQKLWSERLDDQANRLHEAQTALEEERRQGASGRHSESRVLLELSTENARLKADCDRLRDRATRCDDEAAKRQEAERELAVATARVEELSRAGERDRGRVAKLENEVVMLEARAGELDAQVKRADQDAQVLEQERQQLQQRLDELEAEAAQLRDSRDKNDPDEDSVWEAEWEAEVFNRSASGTASSASSSDAERSTDNTFRFMVEDEDEPERAVVPSSGRRKSKRRSKTATVPRRYSAVPIGETRQAATARRRRRARRTLERIRQLRRQLGRAEKALDRANTEAADLRRQYGSAVAELTASNDKLQVVNDKLLGYVTENTRLHSELEAIGGESSRLYDENERAHRELAMQAAALDQLLARVAELEGAAGQAEEHRERSSKLTAELDRLRRELLGAQRALALERGEHEDAMSRAQAAAVRAREENEALVEQNSALAQAVEGRAKQLADAEERLRTTDARVTEAENETAKAREVARRAREEKELDVGALAEELAVQREAAALAKERAAELEAQIEEQDHVRAELEGQVHAMQEQLLQRLRAKEQDHAQLHADHMTLRERAAQLVAEHEQLREAHAETAEKLHVTKVQAATEHHRKGWQNGHEQGLAEGHAAAKREAATRIAELEAGIEALRARCSELDSAAREGQSSSSSLSRQVGELQEQITTLKLDLAEAESRATSAESRLEVAEADLQHANNEAREERETVRGLRERVREVEVELSKLSAREASLVAQVAAKDAELFELNTHAETKGRVYESYKSQFDAMCAEKGELLSTLAEQRAELEALRRSEALARAAKEQLETTVDELTAASRDRHALAERLAQAEAQLTRERASREETAGRIRDERAEYEAEVKRLRADLERARAAEQQLREDAHRLDEAAREAFGTLKAEQMHSETQRQSETARQREADAQVRRLKSQLAQLNGEVAQLSHQVAAKDAQLQDAEASATQWRRKSEQTEREARDRIARIEAERARDEETRRAVQSKDADQAAVYRSRYEDLLEEHRRLAQRLQRLEHDAQRATNDLEAERIRERAAKNVTQEVHARVARFESLLTEAKSKLEESRRRVQQLEQQERANRAEITALSNSCATQAASLEDVLATSRSLQAERDRAVEEVRHMREHVHGVEQAANARLREVERRVDQAEEECRRARADADAARGELAAAKAEADAVRGRVAAAEAEVQRAATAHREAQRDMQERLALAEGEAQALRLAQIARAGSGYVGSAPKEAAPRAPAGSWAASDEAYAALRQAYADEARAVAQLEAEAEAGRVLHGDAQRNSARGVRGDREDELERIVIDLVATLPAQSSAGGVDAEWRVRVSSLVHRLLLTRRALRSVNEALVHERDMAHDAVVASRCYAQEWWREFQKALNDRTLSDSQLRVRLLSWEYFQEASWDTFLDGGRDAAFKTNLDSASERLSKVRAKLHAAEDENQRLEQEKDVLVAQRKKLLKQLKRYARFYDRTVAKQQQEVQHSKREDQRLREERELLQKKQVELQLSSLEQQEAAQQRLTRMRAEIDQLTEQLNNMTDNYVAQSREMDRLKAQIRDEALQQQTIQHVQSPQRSVSPTPSVSALELIDVQSQQIARLEQQKARAEEQKKRLAAELHELKSELRGVHSQLEEQQADGLKQAERRSQLEREKREYSRLLSEALEEIKELQAAETRLVGATSDLEAARATWNAEEQRLRGELRQLELHNVALKTELETERRAQGRVDPSVIVSARAAAEVSDLAVAKRRIRTLEQALRSMKRLTSREVGSLRKQLADLRTHAVGDALRDASADLRSRVEMKVGLLSERLEVTQKQLESAKQLLKEQHTAISESKKQLKSLHERVKLKTARIRDLEYALSQQLQRDEHMLKSQRKGMRDVSGVVDEMDERERRQRERQKRERHRRKEADEVAALRDQVSTLNRRLAEKQAYARQHGGQQKKGGRSELEVGGESDGRFRLDDHEFDPLYHLHRVKYDSDIHPVDEYGSEEDLSAMHPHPKIHVQPVRGPVRRRKWQLPTASRNKDKREIESELRQMRYAAQREIHLAKAKGKRVDPELEQYALHLDEALRTLKGV